MGLYGTNFQLFSNMNFVLPFSFATAVKSGPVQSESGDEREKLCEVWSLTDTDVLAIVKRRIINLMDKIHKSYEVVDTEVDGCDEYGSKLWVFCEDGWSGRSWDLDLAKHHDMLTKKNLMFQNGVKIGYKTYYLDPIMYRQDWYDQSSIEVNLISEEQHAAYIATGEAMSNIFDKIVSNFEKIDTSSYFNRAYHMKTKIKWLLTIVKATGISNFMDALLVAKQSEYLSSQTRCEEYTLIVRAATMLDAADKSLLQISD